MSGEILGLVLFGAVYAGLLLHLGKRARSAEGAAPASSVNVQACEPSSSAS